MGNIQLSRLMIVSFWVLLSLDHGKGSGNLGHLLSAASSCAGRAQ